MGEVLNRFLEDTKARKERAVREYASACDQERNLLEQGEEMSEYFGRNQEDLKAQMSRGLRPAGEDYSKMRVLVNITPGRTWGEPGVYVEVPDGRK